MNAIHAIHADLALRAHAGDGRTLFLLWHRAAGRFLAHEQPVARADGDDCAQPEAVPDDTDHDHAIARMIDEGCPNHE